MGATELSEAMSVLAQDVKSAAEEDALLAETLSEELMEQLEKGSLSPEQLAELAQALGKCKACELGKLRKLAAARLIDASLCDKIGKQCECDPEALALLLCECKGAGACKACISSCNRPGRGGVNRGRGDAEMTWNDGTNRDDLEFKEKVLPPGAVGSLKDARLQGISIGDPTAKESAETSAGGSLDVSTAGRGSARTQVILPEHKKVIQRYFAREPAAKATTPANP
jgi:hypothetical protein